MRPVELIQVVSSVNVTDQIMNYNYFHAFHDDVIKRKHFPRYWPFAREIQWWPVNSPHKGQWRGALMCSLIWSWTHGLANNRDASDLRRHRANYDVTVMLVYAVRRSSIFVYGLIHIRDVWQHLYPALSLTCTDILSYMQAGIYIRASHHQVDLSLLLVTKCLKTVINKFSICFMWSADFPTKDQ